jgi:hypothetical protein
MRKPVAIFAMTMLLAQAAMAQAVSPAPPAPLDLPTVLSAALDHGPKVARADFKVQQAEGRAQQAAGAFDWRASARGGWAHLYYPRVRNIGGTNVLTNDLQSSWDPARGPTSICRFRFCMASTAPTRRQPPSAPA